MLKQQNNPWQIWIAAIVLLFIISSCKKSTTDTVTVSTRLGDFNIHLFEETVEYRKNFLSLTREGYYDSLLFHRVIPDMIIQGGDPSSKNAPEGKYLGQNDVDYTIAPDFRYVHTYGAIAAARQGDAVNPKKKSSGAQFFIVIGHPVTDADLDKIEKEKKFTYTEEQRQLYKLLGGIPQFDRDYTVFGEVISGMDVVEEISRLSRDPNDRPRENVRMYFTLSQKNAEE